MVSAVFVEGLIYAIMVLGVFITFRILDFPDLTVDSSFATGALVMAVSIEAGTNLPVALLLSLVSGLLAGVFTALLHTVLKIPNLLAGIITMTILYSVNFRITSGANYIPINGIPNIVTISVEAMQEMFSTIGLNLTNETVTLIFFILITLIIKLLFDVFFRTDLGISIGALGSNEQMVISQGVNTNYLKILGLAISNGLVALSGAMYAQHSLSASVTSGQGIIIVGLASVMIGELIVRSNKIFFITLGIIAGSIVYKAIIYVGLTYGDYIYLQPNDLKLIAGVLIILIISITNIQKYRLLDKVKKVDILNFIEFILMSFFRLRDAIFTKYKNNDSALKKDYVILNLKNVTKIFSKGTVNEKTVLKNISLEIKKGDFITIIGSNGAGKSTLFNVIAGTYDVTSGKINYKNKNITNMKEYKRAKFIGRIFQNPLLGTSGTMALEDNMILCLKKGMKKPIISLNSKVRKMFAKNVARLNMGLENRLKDNVGLFSGGQRQALTLLMTAMSHPELVLLDEHTAALDPDNSNRVMDLTLKLREEYGLTMMMITHNMQHAIKYGNRLLMMDEGEIIFDISGKEKENLTIDAIMEKFKSIRKDEINDEKLLLTR